MGSGFFSDYSTEEGVYYKCELEAIVRTSKTSKNPNRKFWSCSCYQSKSKPGCGFFDWCNVRVVENTEQRLLNLIANLQSKVCDLEEENGRLAKLLASAHACDHHCDNLATMELQVVKQRLLTMERKLSRVVIN